MDVPYHARCMDLLLKILFYLLTFIIFIVFHLLRISILCLWISFKNFHQYGGTAFLQHMLKKAAKVTMKLCGYESVIDGQCFPYPVEVADDALTAFEFGVLLPSTNSYACTQEDHKHRGGKAVTTNGSLLARYGVGNIESSSSESSFRDKEYCGGACRLAVYDSNFNNSPADDNGVIGAVLNTKERTHDSSFNHSSAGDNGDIGVVLNTKEYIHDSSFIHSPAEDNGVTGAVLNTKECIHDSFNCLPAEESGAIRAVPNIKEPVNVMRGVSISSSVTSGQESCQVNDSPNLESQELKNYPEEENNVTHNLLTEIHPPPSHATEDIASASSEIGNEVVKGKSSACFKSVDLPENVSCLYGQTGKIVTLSNWQFIRTIIEGSSKAIYVDIRKYVKFYLGVGCQFMWDSQAPIPISCIADGTEVKFDAIRLEGKRTFHALFIWKGSKPKYVAELRENSYICQSSFDVICNDFHTQNGVMYVSVFHDKKKIVAEIQSNITYIDCCEEEVKDMGPSHASKKTIFARISKLITDSESDVIYVCSHIWLGTRSGVEGFKVGRIYKRGTSRALVTDDDFDRLHCDLGGQVNKLSEDYVVKFEIDRRVVSLSLPIKKVFLGNHRFIFPMPLDTPVKVHVLERPNLECVIVLVQVLLNPNCIDTCKLPSPEAKVITVEDEHDRGLEESERNKQKISTPFGDNCAYDEDVKMQGPVFLHDHVGKLFTESNKRYIKTNIKGFVDSVFVEVETVETLDIEIGCPVMWHGDLPVPLSEVTDDSKVKFDAIWVPKIERFQAIVIWKYKKPSVVHKLTKDSYMCIESNHVTCIDVSSEDGINYIHAIYNGEMIRAAIVNKSMYVNGNQVNFEQLKIAHESDSNSTYARISKLMKGKKGTPFLHICTCVWSAIRPKEEYVLDRGLIYMLGPRGNIRFNTTCPTLFCDEIVTARATKCNLVLEIKKFGPHNDNGFLPILTKDFDFENDEGSPPIVLKVKTHILTTFKYRHCSLHAQLLEKFTFADNCTFHGSLSERHLVTRVKQKIADQKVKALEEAVKVTSSSENTYGNYAYLESNENSLENGNLLPKGTITSGQNDIYTINEESKSLTSSLQCESAVLNQSLEDYVSNENCVPNMSVSEEYFLQSSKQTLTNSELESQTEGEESLSTEFHINSKEYMKLSKKPKVASQVPSKLHVHEQQTEADSSSQKLYMQVDNDDILQEICNESIFSNNISCLYNQDGEMCTLSSKQYIKTSIDGGHHFINVEFEKRTVSNNFRIGCQILWQGKNPIPLSSVMDGSSVKFDAIWLEDDKRFHAIVIWKCSKPTCVRDPTNRNYLCMENKDVKCTNLSTKNGVNSVECYFEEEKISVPIQNSEVYVNGKQTDFQSLVTAHALNPENTHAQITCLMSGRKGGTFRYLSSCVWSGIRPKKKEFYKRGDTYARSAVSNLLVKDEVYCLYCDLACLFISNGENFVLECKIDDKEILLPLLIKDIHFRNRKLSNCLPDKTNVKAHILKVSEDRWRILLVQLTENPLTYENSPSKKLSSDSNCFQSSDEGFAIKTLKNASLQPSISNENCGQDFLVPKELYLQSMKQTLTNSELKVQTEKTERLSRVFHIDSKEDVQSFENPTLSSKVPSKLHVLEQQAEEDSSSQNFEIQPDNDDKLQEFCNESTFIDNISCLYNQDGEMCTLSNKRYIKTSIDGGHHFINVEFEKRTVSNNFKIGCQILWQGKKPIPLSSVMDGSSVKFDAIWLEHDKRFHAIVIWKYSKPTCVRDPMNKNYLCMENKDVQCTICFTKNGVNSVDCYFEEEMINVPILNGEVYVNGKQSDLQTLAAAHASNPENTHAQITCLMSGRKGGTFRYLSSCVWSGIKPKKKEFYKRGDIYARSAVSNLLVKNEVYCLYCDLACISIRNGENFVLKCKVEDKEMSLPLLIKDIHFGNCRVNNCLSDRTNVKAHILKASETQWHILLVQLTENPSTYENNPSKKLIPESGCSHSSDEGFANKNQKTTEIRPITRTSDDIDCLYSQEGEVFKLLSKYYIKTMLPRSSKLLYVHTERRDWSETRIGCRFICYGQTPVPISDVPIGSKVKFDAIWMPDTKNFQALVIWNGNKPQCVREPSCRTYLCLDTRRLCNDSFTLTDNNMICIATSCDNEEISADVPSNAVFRNGCQGSFQDLRLDILSGKTIHAQVSKFASGTKNPHVRYVCSCVWTDDTLDNDVNVFKIGKVYKEDPKHTLIIDESFSCLYCDLICLPRKPNPDPVFELDVEGSKFLLPIPVDAIYFGNYKWDCELPLNTPLRIHIVKLSVSHWSILHAQILVDSYADECRLKLLSSKSYKFTGDSFPSKTSNQRAVICKNSTARSSTSIRTKKILPLKTAIESISERKENKFLHTKHFDPKFLNNASCVPTSVVEDYIILKIQGKNFSDPEIVFASVRKSDAYVDRRPLCKYVLFHEQVANLTSRTWHCSLQKKAMVIQGKKFAYLATLAWVGCRPTESDIQSFKKVSPESDCSYSKDYKMEGIKNLSSSYENCNIKCGNSEKDLTSLSGYASSYSSDGEVFDDFDLFPTITTDDDKEIIELCR